MKKIIFRILKKGPLSKNFPQISPTNIFFVEFFKSKTNFFQHFSNEKNEKEKKTKKRKKRKRKHTEKEKQ